MKTKRELFRVGFIGDVHGHADEFESLIKQIEDHGVDRLVFLGDLFDRGPDAPRCLRLVKERGFVRRDGRHHPIEMVLGNHEDRNIRVWRKKPIPGRKFAPKPWTPREFEQIKEEEWIWLEQQPFFLRIMEHGLDVCAVHGGFPQDAQSPGWYGFDRSGILARIGYLDSQGQLLSPGITGPRLWADGYDGRFGRCFYGHTSFDAPRISPYAVGLDGTKRGKIFACVVSNQEADVFFERNIGLWSSIKTKTKAHRYNHEFEGSYYNFGFDTIEVTEDGDVVYVDAEESLDDVLDDDYYEYIEYVDDPSDRYNDLFDDPSEMLEELTEKQRDDHYWEILRILRNDDVNEMRSLIEEIKEES